MPRFSLKTLLIAVAALATCLGAWSWLFQKAVYFRPPRSDDRLGEWGIGPPRADEQVRSVAYATGRFNYKTQLNAQLIAVRVGEQFVQYDMELRPYSQQRPIFPSRCEVAFLFKTETIPKGSFTALDSRLTGHLMVSSASGGVSLLNIPARYTYSYSGTITPGRPYIVYVEGDAPITANRNITLSEFARINPGNYFVVAAELK